MDMNMKQDDFLFGILTRLPAKSLIRFICVSKSWCDLISQDSSFIREHLRFQKDSKDSDALLFLRYWEQRNLMKDASIEYLSLAISEHMKMQSPWKRPWINDVKQRCDWHKYFFLAGECNGLVCISDAYNVIIWNPIIWRFKILPDSDDFNHQLETLDEYGRRSDNETVIGFGFLTSADHEYYYKVVRVTYTCNRGVLSRSGHPSLVEVYNSKTDSWKRIVDHDVRSIMERTNTSTFVAGSLYWLGVREKTNEEEERWGSNYPFYYPKITAFNLADEKFREIKLPDHGFDFHTTDTAKNIAAFGESQLALFAGDNRHRLLITIWVMEVDQLSWTKLFRINLHADPLGFSRNGEVILRMTAYKMYGNLVLHDPKLQDPCHVRDLGFKADHATNHVESLLLLDGETCSMEEMRDIMEPNHAEETTKHAGEGEEEDWLEGFMHLFD